MKTTTYTNTAIFTLEPIDNNHMFVASDRKTGEELLRVSVGSDELTALESLIAAYKEQEEHAW